MAAIMVLAMASTAFAADAATTTTGISTPGTTSSVAAVTTVMPAKPHNINFFPLFSLSFFLL